MFSSLVGDYIRNKDVKLKIAILGAPSSGKSTLSAGLLYFSKLFSFKVDQVPEVAKWHVYKGSNFKAPNFEYEKFEEQKCIEDIYPKELDITICEAPLITSAIYSRYYRGSNDPVTKDMLSRAVESKNRYTHFFVTRKLVEFENFGRNENHKQAEDIHGVCIRLLEELNINYTVINKYDEHVPIQILSTVGAIRALSQSDLFSQQDNFFSLNIKGGKNA